MSEPRRYTHTANGRTWQLYGCARRGCDTISLDYESFGTRDGKSYCGYHIPLRSKLRLWWQERCPPMPEPSTGPERGKGERERSLDPTHNALVAALRQALTDIRCFETWFRKEDEGTGYGQPHLGQADARRSAERIAAVLRDHTHQDDGFLR